MILPLSGDDIFGSCVLLQFVSSYYYNGKNETNFQQFLQFLCRVGSCGSYCDVQKSSAIGRQFGECDGVRIADRPFHFAKKCATSTSFDYYSNKLSLLLDISHKFTK